MTIRQMQQEDVQGVVALQRSCFPPPFPQNQLWQAGHIQKHLEVFPEGQLVAVDGQVVGSASNCVIDEEAWQAHKSWMDTVGGPFIENHNPAGTTLYGLDISVHPAFRGQGIARALYRERFKLVRVLKLKRYGTACRMPGFLKWSKATENPNVEQYAELVAQGRLVDPTMTPLVKMGLTYKGVIRDYMDDEESDNSAAMLEWLCE